MADLADPHRGDQHVSPRASEVLIYTDGACLGNPGPGGYAAVLLKGSHRKEFSGGYRRTTNNRMEIMAAIVGLEALRWSCAVRLHTDSKYLQQSITLGWALRWRARGWKKRDGRRSNWDLWARLLAACERHKVEFVWVKGHAGDRENERCDTLSVAAAQRTNLPADSFYEQPLKHDPEGPGIDLEQFAQPARFEKKDELW